MIFSELEYKRVDMEALKAELKALTEQLVNAQNFEEAEAAFLAKEKAEGMTMGTMRTIAQIRRDIDTRDEFYDAEMSFYHQEAPKLQPIRKAWTDALLKSPYRAQFEEKYGPVCLSSMPSLLLAALSLNWWKTCKGKTSWSASIPS